jgi:hypothetical protein
MAGRNEMVGGGGLGGDVVELRMMHRGDSRAASRRHGPRRGHRDRVE